MKFNRKMFLILFLILLIILILFIWENSIWFGNKENCAYAGQYWDTVKNECIF